MKLTDITFAKEIITKCLTICQICSELHFLPWERTWEGPETNILSQIIKDVYASDKTITSANADLGYVVDNEGFIHCINSPSWIWQFDGCKETEIKIQ